MRAGGQGGWRIAPARPSHRRHPQTSCAVVNYHRVGTQGANHSASQYRNRIVANAAGSDVAGIRRKIIGRGGNRRRCRRHGRVDCHRISSAGAAAVTGGILDLGGEAMGCIAEARGVESPGSASDRSQTQSGRTIVDSHNIAKGRRSVDSPRKRQRIVIGRTTRGDIAGSRLDVIASPGDCCG